MALFRRNRDPRSSGMSRVTAGLIALVVIAVFSYFGFTKSNPFADPVQGHGACSRTPTT